MAIGGGSAFFCAWLAGNTVWYGLNLDQ